jgi:ABC-type transport system involved in multi-copper enzyme maturation permease subunit
MLKAINIKLFKTNINSILLIFIFCALILSFISATKLSKINITTLDIESFDSKSFHIQSLDIQSFDPKSFHIQNLDIQSFNPKSVHIQNLDIQSLNKETLDIEDSGLKRSYLRSIDLYKSDINADPNIPDLNIDNYNINL